MSVLLQDDGHVSKLTFTTEYGLEVSLLVRSTALSRDARLAAISHLVLMPHDLVDESARAEGWEDAMTLRPPPPPPHYEPLPDPTIPSY